MPDDLGKSACNHPDRLSTVVINPDSFHARDTTLLGAVVPVPVARAFKALMAKQGKTLTWVILEMIAFEFIKEDEPLPPELDTARAQFGPNGRRRRMRHVPERERD
jgi:hypothetical protein